MKEKEQRAYLKLLYFVLLEIRELSSKHGSFFKSSNKQTRIYELSDIFHNLPLLLKSDTFDEGVYWNQINSVVPDRAERYREISLRNFYSILSLNLI